MYVWVDALTTYMTGVGYPDTEGMFAKYWPADLHLIGKDIVRFHAVYWPAFLMSAGLPLPKQVFGHGFLLNRGEKMSKSVGNVVDPMQLAEQFGVDQLRYFLLSDVVFGKDGTYSADAIVTKTNADLANNFGNLAQRSLSMIGKNCDGKVPAPGEPTAAEEELLAQLDQCFIDINAAMTGGLFKIDTALDTIRERLSATNTYFADQAPWALRQEPIQCFIIPLKQSGNWRSCSAGRYRKAVTGCSICWRSPLTQGILSISLQLLCRG